MTKKEIDLIEKLIDAKICLYDVKDQKSLEDLLDEIYEIKKELEKGGGK